MNNADETEKKLLRDVYKKGDVCFRSGDLMVKDEDGWLFFKVNCCYLVVVCNDGMGSTSLPSRIVSATLFAGAGRTSPPRRWRTS